MRSISMPSIAMWNLQQFTASISLFFDVIAARPHPVCHHLQQCETLLLMNGQL